MKGVKINELPNYFYIPYLPLIITEPMSEHDQYYNLFLDIENIEKDLIKVLKDAEKSSISYENKIDDFNYGREIAYKHCINTLNECLKKYR